MRPTGRLLPLLCLVLTLGLVSAAAPAGAAPQGRTGAVATRGVVFDLVNNGSGLLCAADGREHPVRARLVGPPSVVGGNEGVLRVNVLVHDAGTGGWFWNLRSQPQRDYATQLARRGETSLVVDRLGYDASRLRSGDDTCLTAQADMLHQVVQRLYSGRYRATSGRGSLPHASQVVLHGHGTGATIAQLEASRYDDVAGLVLMSLPSTRSTTAALAAVRDQTRTCLGAATFAPYGASAAAYRRLLFASAPAAVRTAATRQRNATPCGDVTSLSEGLLTSTLTAGEVDARTLVLTGSRDVRTRPMTTSQARSVFSGAPSVRAVTIRGAGSALPLERQAPRVQRQVVGFLRALPPTRN